jgi:hypothetical protein
MANMTELVSPPCSRRYRLDVRHVSSKLGASASACLRPSGNLANGSDRSSSVVLIVEELPVVSRERMSSGKALVPIEELGFLTIRRP